MVDGRGGLRRRRFGYRNPGRSSWYLALSLLGVSAASTIVSAIARGEPSLGVVLPWSAIAVGSGYLFGWKVGHSVEVEDGIVTWRAVLRTRTVLLSDLSGSLVSGTGVRRIGVRTGPSLMVAGRGRGWALFWERLRLVTGVEDSRSSELDRPFGSMPERAGGFYEGPDERWDQGWD